MRPQSTEIWRKFLQAQVFRQNYVLYSYFKKDADTYFKKTMEREFLVDSGASMHMMRKSSGEMDTVKKSRNPTVVLTANGEVLTHKEAQVFVHDLNQFVTVRLLAETHAVLSPGKLC